MNNKVLRKIFAFLCAIIMISSVAGEAIAKLAHTEKDATQAFGIAQRHASKHLNGEDYVIGSDPVELQYITDGKTVYRVFAGTEESSGDFTTAIICLDKNGKFPKEPGSSNQGQYKSLGNIQESGITSQAELQWLVDNAIIPEDSPEMKDQKLAEIFEALIESTKNDVNPVRVEDIKEVMTEDDIMIALQIAAWSVTNGYTMYNLKGNNGITESSLFGNSIFGRNKGEFIRYMVNYYKDGMINKPTGTSGNSPVIGGAATATASGSDIFIGDYIIGGDEPVGDYTVDVSFYDEDGQKLNNVNYHLLDGNTISSNILAPTKHDLHGKPFYIRIDRNTKARKVTLTLTPKMIGGTSVGTVWSTDNEGDQKLLSIEREEVTPNPVIRETPFTVTPEEYSFDAALRKNISKIIRYNKLDDTSVTYTIDGTNDRTPVPHKAQVGEFNEYSYTHRKDPYLLELDENVEVIVVYKMTVFNESDKPIRITSITDYLPPSGLEFNLGVNEEDPRFSYNNENGWVYSATSNSITTTALGGIQLDPVEVDGTVHRASVEIALDVTEQARGKIITNIAEISGYETVPSGGSDHDSGYLEGVVRKKKVVLPTTEEEWQNYNGNDNKDELNDSSYYYKGQEDDDDFEKIKVRGDMDIALRKNITHVNGKAVSPTRIGQINTQPLLRGAVGLGGLLDGVEAELGATADYSADIKTPPVEVKAGDLVTYKIRLLNEGQVEAYATDVTDFLPDGLAFIPEYNDNVNNGWTIVAGTGTLKSLAEVDVNNMVTNSSLYGTTRENAKVYVGPVTIHSAKKKDTILRPFNRATQTIDESEFLQLTCLVVEPRDLEDQKVLRNISVISGYADSTKTEANGDGTDSVKDNVNSPEEFNITTHEDDEDYDDVIITKEVNFYDLALKKFITKITTADGTVKTIPADQARNCVVEDVTQLVNRDSENPKADAVYSLNKDKISIEDGDIITYTIRVYNEGTQDAIVKEIIDNVPKGLEFVTYEKNPDGTYKSGSHTNYEYQWEVFNENVNGTTGWSSGVRTTITDDEDRCMLHAFDKTKVNTTDTKGLTYVDVQIEFKVNLAQLTDAERAEIMISGIKNLAEITVDDGDDNDSTPNNKVESEDDEDYDVVVPNIYDLALKKAVTEVIGNDLNPKTIPANEKRTITVSNTDSLKNRTNNGKADATYQINKELPVSVADGDYVIFTLRVYNEGRQDAKVQEVVDNIPLGLEFVEYTEDQEGHYVSGSVTNQKYKWKKITNTEGTWTDGYKTDYLKNTTIPAFDNSQSNGTNKEKGLSYEDIKIEFKVNLSKLTKEQRQEIMSNGIINIAEITGDNGSDNDSDPGNENPDEDDLDRDFIIPKEFDLSLRKFIYSMNQNYREFGPDRTPEVEYRNGKIIYSHPKDPVIVRNGDYVQYVIRVYNEGTQDGYAAEISDTIPKGLKFEPGDTLNEDFRWKMYDKNGKQTDNPDEAVTIKTDYLSKENEKTPGANLIKAFDSSSEIIQGEVEYFEGEDSTTGRYNPDYRDVLVDFYVDKSPTEDPKVMINTAEITEDTDEHGNPVDDVDSTPGNNDEDEDDIDTESVEMKYFDLSLLKYVSKVYVTEDGVTKEIETGYTGLENPEPIVKIELNKNKVDRTVIKYMYTIKVTNEGEIEGYAKEIKDRIPNGLAFNEADNTQWGWKVSEDGIVTTDYTKDILLRPGQSTEVPIILTWVNYNWDLKINVAEISEDENEYGIPDIDSTPNNNKDGEDDQDDAIVQLSVSTGAAKIYLTLIISVMAILSTGAYVIYKYVLKK